MYLLASSNTNKCQHYYTWENPLPMGPFGLNAYIHPWTYQVTYVFPPPAAVPQVLSKFIIEHVTGQFRLLFLVTSCLMEAS